MNKIILLFFISFTSLASSQNNILKYSLLHQKNSNHVKITIEFDSISTKDSYLQVAMSAPGTYEITEYSNFIENIEGTTTKGSVIKGQRGRGSIFFFRNDAYINKISYEVNILKMETELKGGFASSKMRANYLGILGYSVFGSISGLKDKPIQLTIKSNANWPIYTTLKPQQHPSGETTTMVENYSMLADAQYLLGSDVKVHKVANSKIPLFVAVYSETDINIEEIGRRGLLSLNGLSDYFGYIPMPHYTLCYEFLEPYSSEHSYGFSMEHMNSMTASLTTKSAINAYEADANIFGIIHHMGHSWIPLRSYGKGYRPFDWESAPIIETIWLNEGFIWYVTATITESPNTIIFFKNVLKSAPLYIKEKSLKALSQLGSTQYSLDFNIGRNLFSRGALMAKEMDDKIKAETNGEKTFKDALLGLLKWTEKNQRAFNYNEIEPIISRATNTDLSDIWKKWQKPMNN